MKRMSNTRIPQQSRTEEEDQQNHGTTTTPPSAAPTTPSSNPSPPSSTTTPPSTTPCTSHSGPPPTSPPPPREAVILNVHKKSNPPVQLRLLMPRQPRTAAATTTTVALTQLAHLHNPTTYTSHLLQKPDNSNAITPQPFPTDDPTSHIKASCNGLLLQFFQTENKEGLHVENPITAQSSRLPPLPTHANVRNGYGFAYDQTHNVYKVVCLLEHPDKSIHCAITTVGGMHGWRLSDNRHFMMTGPNSPVWASDAWHWVTTSQKFAVSVGVSGEDFRKTKLPVPLKDVGKKLEREVKYVLAELEGKLVMGDYVRPPRMEVWVLTNDDEWTWRWNIDMRVLGVDPHKVVVRRLVLANDGWSEMVMMVEEGPAAPGRLRVYSVDDERLKKVELPGYGYVAALAAYTESHVRF